jgi:two-component system, LytTR family, response regulator LytT
MKVIIVEDEKLAADRLRLLLHEYDPDVKVEACIDSVADTIQYLKTKPHPDVMLMDIHLSDGHSFEILQKYPYQKPVIFTTAYDEYALEAFKMLSIDYILKPITQEALGAALNKYKQLAATFSGNHYNKLSPEFISQPFKKRFLGKIGQRLFFINTETIACFEADNKIVYLTDQEGHRYLIDATMEKLETQIDPQQFFRISRSFIVHINAIEQVKPYFNNRLRIFLKGTLPETEIVVSRERVADFKNWANS